MENNPLNIPEVIETPDLLTRLLTALIKEPCFNESITVGQVKAITQHLAYAYGIGFDEGRKIMSHRVKVAQFKYGVKVREFDSIADAARAVKGDISTIQKVCAKSARGNKSHKGYQWEYVK